MSAVPDQREEAARRIKKAREWIMNTAESIAFDRCVGEAEEATLYAERDELLALLSELQAEQDELRKTLKRAAFVAEHLMQMIDPQTWRDSGGDDGQGHYEGDYRAEQTMEEIESWKNL